MAKEKKTKGSVPNKNVHLRLSFLHQAASYLANDATKDSESRDNKEGSTGSRSAAHSLPRAVQTRHLLTHMKGVSRKSVIRLHKDVKRTVCKGCDQLLNERSSSRMIENGSKDSEKPWADVLVVKCEDCGTAKRFPCAISALRDRTLKKDVGDNERRRSPASNS